MMLAFFGLWVFKRSAASLVQLFCFSGAPVLIQASHFQSKVFPKARRVYDYVLLLNKQATAMFMGCVSVPACFIFFSFGHTRCFYWVDQWWRGALGIEVEIPLRDLYWYPCYFKVAQTWNGLGCQQGR